MQSHSSEQLTIRPFQRRDIFEILKVERQNFESPSYELRLEGCFKHGKTVARVAEFEDKLVAFVICSVVNGQCQILHLAVHAAHRRCEFGKQLLDYALNHAKQLDRRRIVVRVAESNLPAQKLFRKAGFRAIAFDGGRIPESASDESEIVMELRVGDCAVPFDDLTMYQPFAFYLKDGSVICGDFRGFVPGKPARLRIQVKNGQREPRTSRVSFVSRINEVASVA